MRLTIIFPSFQICCIALFHCLVAFCHHRPIPSFYSWHCLAPIRHCSMLSCPHFFIFSGITAFQLLSTKIALFLRSMSVLRILVALYHHHPICSFLRTTGSWNTVIDSYLYHICKCFFFYYLVFLFSQYIPQH